MRRAESAGARILNAALAWQPGAMAGSSAALLGWLVVRASAQAGLVLLLARGLGASDYGMFVAAIAVGSMLGQLAGLGLPGAVLRLGSTDADALASVFGPALRANTLGITVIVALAALFTLFNLTTTHWPWMLLLLVPVEIASTSLTELLARSMQADHSSHRFGLLQAGLPLARLLVIGVVLATGAPSLEHVCIAYAALTCIYLSAAACYTWRRIRRATSLLRTGMGTLVATGAPFLVGGLAARLQAEYNKPLLARLDAVHAGQFNIAQRVIDIASLPLLAIQDALWPRLYRSARPAHGALRAGMVALPVSLVVSLCIAAMAGALPRIMGPGYENVGTTVLLLAALPPLSLLRNLIIFPVLVSQQPARVIAVHAGMCLTSILATTILVPEAGIHGAVVATYASEASAILLATIAFFSRRKGRAK